MSLDPGRGGRQVSGSCELPPTVLFPSPPPPHPHIHIADSSHVICKGQGWLVAAPRVKGPVL